MEHALGYFFLFLMVEIVEENGEDVAVSGYGVALLAVDNIVNQCLAAIVPEEGRDGFAQYLCFCRALFGCRLVHIEVGAGCHCLETTAEEYLLE